ncbi:MAG TPA: hypothetical protein VMT00_04600 [Thermoanaerobaculia bacterium]|nr:hypothetical protein [Thermoanaerobaculia bacterium]
MNRRLQGRYVRLATSGEEAFKAFVPAPLPPRPPIDWTPALRARFDAALVALGRLDAVTDLLPNAALLLYSFVRIVAELTRRQRGRVFSYARYAGILNEGMGLPGGGDRR